MKITERELEDFIFDKLNKGKNQELLDLGFDFFVVNNKEKKDPFMYYRQLSLGDYGRCDIIGFETIIREQIVGEGINYDFNYTLIELKEGEISKDIIFQCIRYKNAIEKCNIYANKVYGDLVIVGSSVSKEVFDLINLTLGTNVFVYLYDISLENGISFKLVNEPYFSNEKCCSNPHDHKSCNGSCFSGLSVGSSLFSKIEEMKSLCKII